MVSNLRMSEDNQYNDDSKPQNQKHFNKNSNRTNHRFDSQALLVHPS